MTISDRDLYWVAGFLEGEGCFYTSDSYIRITAGQKDRESLDKLQLILGGRIYDQRNRDLFLWSMASQPEVLAVIALLYPLLSQRRREQIDAALAKRTTRGISNEAKTHCPRGHVYDDITPTARRCTACRREYSRERSRRWKAKQT